MKIQNWFILHYNPWFVRGYYTTIGNGTGVFAFDTAYGNASVYGSFRVVHKL